MIFFNCLYQEDCRTVSLERLSDEAGRLEKLSKQIMSGARDHIYESMTPKIGCEKGVNDSALIALMCITAEDKRLRKCLVIDYRQEMKCQICQCIRESRYNYC